MCLLCLGPHLDAAPWLCCCLETAKLLFACTPRRCCSFYERYSCTSTTICRCCFVHKDQNLVINYYSIIHYDV